MKTPFKYIPYDAAMPLLEDGDVLCFRGRSVVSAAIAAVTTSPVTHVGIAGSRRDEKGRITGWSCIEFREFRGGREVDLLREVIRNDGQIDVYRASEVFHEYILDEFTREIVHLEKAFRGKGIVSGMRRLTGLPYSKKRIVCIYAWKIPFLRAFLCCCRKGYTDDRVDNLRLSRFVCSTAIDYTFRLRGYPLIQNKNTNYVDPSDLARSPNLHYLFTLSHPRTDWKQNDE